MDARQSLGEVWVEQGRTDEVGGLFDGIVADSRCDRARGLRPNGSRVGSGWPLATRRPPIDT